MSKLGDKTANRPYAQAPKLTLWVPFLVASALSLFFLGLRALMSL